MLSTYTAISSILSSFLEVIVLRYIVLLLLASALIMPAHAANNPYGVHMLSGGSAIQDWASSLIGPGGYCKQLFMGITNGTSGPSGSWVSFVQGCYDRQMIPICRLATNYSNGQWNAPVPNSPGDYSSFAQAVKHVVQGLPRHNDYPLYIEILNEVNSPKEWGGDADPWEYAHCLVDCAEAIRSIGDSRIKIMNAGLAGGPGFIDDMFDMVPESLWAFDVYAVHSYSLNRPPEINRHAGLAGPGDICIDSYLDDIAVIESHGRYGVKVILTETGYALDDQTFTNYPIVNEDNRADYIVRAFRDYWSKWPEVLAVTPFEFLDTGGGWRSFDWIYSDSGTGTMNRPTNAHKQYYDVWNLAKPNMTRGGISGRVKEAAFGGNLSGATVTLNPGGYTTSTDSIGNYYFPNSSNLSLVSPGTYSLTAGRTGFANQTISSVVVTAGNNSVVNFSLSASGTGSISGQVVDPYTGLGIQGVSISVSPGGASATTDTNGAYLIQSLAPSTYNVSATKTAYRSFSHTGLVVATDQTALLDFCLAPGADPARQNMLLNTDLEYGGGASGSGVANGWANVANSPFPSIFAIDTDVKFSGRASQRITPNGNSVNWIGQWTGYGTIYPGQRYKFQAWCKTSNPSGGGAMVIATLSRYGESTDGQVIAQPVLTTNSGWTLLQGYGVIPNLWGGASGRLRLELHGAKYGTTWFDRAFVSTDDRSDNPVPPPHAFAAASSQGRVLLTWTNPANSTGTTIVARTDRYPLSRTDGQVLADVAGSPGSLGTYDHTGLQVGVRYYYGAFSHTSGPANFSDPSFASGVAVDNTPPTTPQVVDDGNWTRSGSTLHAAWSSNDPESGIIGYEYSIGTSVMAADVVPWTSAAASTELNRSGLTLANGQTYYINVRATNGVGISSAGSSNGIKVAAPATTIGEAKKLGDVTFVWLEDKEVTAGRDAFSGVIYVEEQDRSAGIGVSVSSFNYNTGCKATVVGTLAGTGFERVLSSGSATYRGASQTPAPLALAPKFLWASDGLPSPLTQGLLVRTYGRVVEVGVGYFTLDTFWNGSRLKVFSFSHAKPANGSFVAVTGIVGADGSGGTTVPVLKLRFASDWTSF